MIQRNRLFRFIVFIVCVVANQACTDDFEEINTDPSLITREAITPELLFAGAQKSAIFDIHSNDRIEEWAGYYENQASSKLRDYNWSDPFMSTYRNEIMNISEAIRLTEDSDRMRNENAMARIWKVWLFHRLTDAYGPIPYFEAALDVDKAEITPLYDSQEVIYKDMLNELKLSAAQLNNDEEQFSFGESDLLYSGDVDSWKRFANSLRLRLAVRIKYIDNNLASQHINEVISAPLIETNDQMASLVTLGESAAITNNRNPIYNSYVGNTVPKWASLTVSEELLKRNDPRLEVYLLPAPDPEDGELWRGRPFAVDLELLPGWEESARYTQDRVARLGERFYQAEYEIKVMTASEVYFLRAEAALANITSEDENALFQEGIRLSMEHYDVETAEISSYLDTEFGSLSGTEEQQLENIIVQKWIGNYYQAWEAWSEYRRTGYPVIWIGEEDGSVVDIIPRRLTYPEDEYVKNGENVKAAVSLLENGDSYLSRVWWDVRPNLPYSHPKQGQFPPEMGYEYTP